MGLANFINVIFTGIYSRQKELAVLESIGMTRKQIKITLCSRRGLLLWHYDGSSYDSGRDFILSDFPAYKKWRDIFCGLFFSGSTDVVCVCDSGDRMCNRTPCSSSFGIKRELGGTSEKRAGLRKKGVI